MKLIIKNSHIEVHDYNIGDCISLENQFMYIDRTFHNTVILGMYYDTDNSILYLPRGIDIWWLEQKLDIKAIVDKNYDKFNYIDNIGLLTPPRENQKEALRFMVCAGEYTSNQYKSQLCLNLNTGKGKTYISVASITYYQITTILIMSSISYIEQWTQMILQYTNISPKEIKHINGSASINRLLRNKNNSYKIYLVTHSTLQRFASTNGWEKVGELFKHLQIGIKIFDEAHQNFNNVCMIDFFTNTYKTFYVTASPARSSEEEDKIYKKYFKNVPSIELFDEEEDPHTKYIAIKFNSNPSPIDIANCRNQYGLNRVKYMEYLIDKPEYLQLLRVILQLALNSDGKCLIYIGLNSAIEFTYRWIICNYEELYNNVGIFTTLVSPQEKEEAKNKKIILSTTKSAGAAVDIKGLKMTVIINEPFKSQVIAQQLIGRTRDQDTYCIECIDIGFKQIAQYYNYKQPVIEKYCTGNALIRLNRKELEERSNGIISSRGKINLVTRELVYWKRDNNYE